MQILPFAPILRRPAPRNRVRRCDSFRCALALLLAVATTMSMTAIAQTVRDYDIVYVRQARFGDNVNTTWPEVFHPAQLDPGADLMLLHPDGSRNVV